jgi:hypothetical protein
VATSATDARRLKKFDEVTARAYGDTRLSAGTRELVLAMTWVMNRDPDYRQDGSVFPRVKTILGPPTQRWRENGRRSRMSELIEADAPRYEPPRETECHGSAAFCEAPRIRAYKPREYAPRTKPDPGLVQPVLLHPRPPTITHYAPGAAEPPPPSRADSCGSTGHTLVVEKAPGTGWHIAHWFCRRHLDHARRVEAQLAEQNERAPEPVPNRGGHLASYFKADFEQLYRYHCSSRWEPPVYGLCADDWPIPGVEPVPQRARLRLAAFDGELLSMGG